MEKGDLFFSVLMNESREQSLCVVTVLHADHDNWFCVLRCDLRSGLDFVVPETWETQSHAAPKMTWTTRSKGLDHVISLALVLAPVPLLTQLPQASQLQLLPLPAKSSTSMPQTWN